MKSVVHSGRHARTSHQCAESQQEPPHAVKPVPHAHVWFVQTPPAPHSLSAQHAVAATHVLPHNRGRLAGHEHDPPEHTAPPEHSAFEQQPLAGTHAFDPAHSF